MAHLLDVASAIVGLEGRRLEIAGQNIANIATTGYKRQLPFSQLLSAPASPAGVLPQAALHSQIGALVPALGVATDFRPAPLRATGVPTHLAISGEGFFQVATPDGIGYTRYGTFALDDNGHFVTPQGWVLQGAGGGDLVVREKTWRFESDGTLIADGRPAGRAAVMTFRNPAALERATLNLFRARERGIDADNPQLRTGFVESANVSTAADFVSIMESVRRAEMGQKFVHAYDDMMGRALRQLGEAA
ncbi:flagellar hook basal-body protein [Cupriavidus basilensis]|uniref:Flagellar hook basal-body protein n=1 Tax=Cupriavidus basilensis TaxID=68895 RepID=A0ABT6AW38_9BURK|nr:flagellar hook basal-body protein [Cupriavidus basilensis]MDF3836837.1 flagellar hook basal-body protein [Cupriavidus basilensis]